MSEPESKSVPNTMSEQQNAALMRLVSAYQSEWSTLVDIAVAWRANKVQVDVLALGTASKKNPDAIMAKLAAISAALDDGATPEQIIERGERETLTSKAKKRAASSDGLTAMNFRVAADLKDRVMACLEKIKAAMQYGTMEHCWMWFDSLVTDLTDEEIRHLAGEGKQ